MPLTYNEIVASTLFNQREETADAIMSAVPLTNELVAKGNVERVSGGYELRAAVEYALPSVQYFNGFQQLNNASYEGLTSCYVDWRQAQAPVAVDGMTIRKNKGNAQQLVNLLDTKMNAAKKALKVELQTSLKSDGSRLGGTEFTGLRACNAKTPTNTYAGIDRSTYTWFKNQVVSFASTLGKPASAATIQEAFLKAYLLTTIGNESPQVAFAGNTYWSYYHNSLTAIQRLTDEGSTSAKAGYRTLMFMNTRVILDNAADDASDPTCDFVNLDYTKFIVHEDGYFAPLGSKREPVDQDAVIQYIFLMGNLLCSNPRMNCLISA